MKTTIITGNEVAINYAFSKLTGYGHHKIIVELDFAGEFKTFSKTTNNMPAFDEANDLEGEDKWEALYNIIANDIEDEVAEWIEELN